jgi:putative ABC transport system ATP-binding protein
LIEHSLQVVGLSGKSSNRISELSGGERQRTSIARAIVNSPDYILADEPCGNLDSENSNIVMTLFKKFSNNGKTVLLVTHNKSDALKADRIIELKDGRIIFDECP